MEQGRPREKAPHVPMTSPSPGYGTAAPNRAPTSTLLAHTCVRSHLVSQASTTPLPILTRFLEQFLINKPSDGFNQLAHFGMRYTWQCSLLI
jgi:hypothetical protein